MEISSSGAGTLTQSAQTQVEPKPQAVRAEQKPQPSSDDSCLGWELRAQERRQKCLRCP